MTVSDDVTLTTPFTYSERQGKFDFRALSKIDINGILETNDALALQPVLGNIIFAHLTEEDIECTPTGMIAKLIHIMQLALEYMNYVQGEVSTYVASTEETMAHVHTKNEFLSEENRRLRAALHAHRRANRVLRQSIKIRDATITDATRPPALPDTVFKCEFCKKVFIDMKSLLGHYQRRHPDEAKDPRLHTLFRESVSNAAAQGNDIPASTLIGGSNTCRKGASNGRVRMANVKTLTGILQQRGNETANVTVAEASVDGVPTEGTAALEAKDLSVENPAISKLRQEYLTMESKLRDRELQVTQLSSTAHAMLSYLRQKESVLESAKSQVRLVSEKSKCLEEKLQELGYLVVHADGTFGVVPQHPSAAFHATRGFPPAASAALSHTQTFPAPGVLGATQAGAVDLSSHNLRSTRVRHVAQRRGGAAAAAAAARAPSPSAEPAPTSSTSSLLSPKERAASPLTPMHHYQSSIPSPLTPQGAATVTSPHAPGSAFAPTRRAQPPSSMSKSFSYSPRPHILSPGSAASHAAHSITRNVNDPFRLTYAWKPLPTGVDRAALQRLAASKLQQQQTSTSLTSAILGAGGFTAPSSRSVSRVSGTVSFDATAKDFSAQNRTITGGLDRSTFVLGDTDTVDTRIDEAPSSIRISQRDTSSVSREGKQAPIYDTTAASTAYLPHDDRDEAASHASEITPTLLSPPGNLDTSYFSTHSHPQQQPSPVASGPTSPGPTSSSQSRYASLASALPSSNQPSRTYDDNATAELWALALPEYAEISTATWPPQARLPPTWPLELQPCVITLSRARSRSRMDASMFPRPLPTVKLTIVPDMHVSDVLAVAKSALAAERPVPALLMLLQHGRSEPVSPLETVEDADFFGNRPILLVLEEYLAPEDIPRSVRLQSTRAPSLTPGLSASRSGNVLLPSPDPNATAGTVPYVVQTMPLPSTMRSEGVEAVEPTFLDNSLASFHADNALATDASIGYFNRSRDGLESLTDFDEFGDLDTFDDIPSFLSLDAMNFNLWNQRLKEQGLQTAEESEPLSRSMSQSRLQHSRESGSMITSIHGSEISHLEVPSFHLHTGTAFAPVSPMSSVTARSPSQSRLSIASPETTVQGGGEPHAVPGRRIGRGASLLAQVDALEKAQRPGTRASNGEGTMESTLFLSTSTVHPDASSAQTLNASRLSKASAATAAQHNRSLSAPALTRTLPAAMPDTDLGTTLNGTQTIGGGLPSVTSSRTLGSTGSSATLHQSRSLSASGTTQLLGPHTERGVQFLRNTLQSSMRSVFGALLSPPATGGTARVPPFLRSTNPYAEKSATITTSVTAASTSAGTSIEPVREGVRSAQSESPAAQRKKSPFSFFSRSRSRSGSASATSAASETEAGHEHSPSTGAKTGLRRLSSSLKFWKKRSDSSASPGRTSDAHETSPTAHGSATEAMRSPQPTLEAVDTVTRDGIRRLSTGAPRRVSFPAPGTNLGAISGVVTSTTMSMGASIGKGIGTGIGTGRVHSPVGVHTERAASRSRYASREDSPGGLEVRIRVQDHVEHTEDKDLTAEAIVVESVNTPRSSMTTRKERRRSSAYAITPQIAAAARLKQESLSAAIAATLIAGETVASTIAETASESSTDSIQRGADAYEAEALRALQEQFQHAQNAAHGEIQSEEAPAVVPEQPLVNERRHSSSSTNNYNIVREASTSADSRSADGAVEKALAKFEEQFGGVFSDMESVPTEGTVHSLSSVSAVHGMSDSSDDSAHARPDLSRGHYTPSAIRDIAHGTPFSPVLIHPSDNDSIGSSPRKVDGRGLVPDEYALDSEQPSGFSGARTNAAPPVTEDIPPTSVETSRETVSLLEASALAVDNVDRGPISTTSIPKDENEEMPALGPPAVPDNGDGDIIETQHNAKSTLGIYGAELVPPASPREENSSVPVPLAHFVENEEGLDATHMSIQPPYEISIADEVAGKDLLRSTEPDAKETSNQPTFAIEVEEEDIIEEEIEIDANTGNSAANGQTFSAAIDQPDISPQESSSTKQRMEEVLEISTVTTSTDVESDRTEPIQEILDSELSKAVDVGQGLSAVEKSKEESVLVDELVQEALQELEAEVPAVLPGEAGVDENNASQASDISASSLIESEIQGISDHTASSVETSSAPAGNPVHIDLVHEASQSLNVDDLLEEFS